MSETLSGYPGSARISPCDQYRSTLERRFLVGDGEAVNFVMANPSRADDRADDPTVRRCIRFAQAWGFSRLVVTNLFALRSTDPAALKNHPEPIGPENDAALLIEAVKARLVVCAWGAVGNLFNRPAAVRGMLEEHGVELHFLSLTRGGEPGHPLYLRADLKPQPWIRP